MSFLSKGLAAISSSVKNLTNAGTSLQFGDINVVTTALLAEGGYSYVYSAREVGVSARVFAAKKVLAQDAETRDVAEVETRCLQQFDGHPGFVRCFGATSKSLPNNRSVECAPLCSPPRLPRLLASSHGRTSHAQVLDAARVLHKWLAHRCHLQEE